MSEEFELISVPKELLENLVRRILAEYISLSTPEPEQDEEPIKLKWEKDKPGPYNNWSADTPFGPILITWKGWKDYQEACIDEFPGELPQIFGAPDYVRDEAEKELFRRCKKFHPAPRKPFVRLSEEEIMAIVRADPDFDEMMWDKTAVRFARAIEDALEEKNR